MRLLILVLVVSPAARAVAGEDTLLATRTLGTAPDAPLYSVSGIAEDPRGNLYVTDMLDYSVKKFDWKGALRGKVGRRGTGPGEFRSPSLSLVTGGKLLVMQTRERRVQVFDTDLVYRGEFVVDGGMPVDIAAVKPAGMAVALFGDSARGTVLLLKGPEDGHPRRVRLEPSGRLHPLYAAVRIAVCRDGSVVAAYLFLNRVELYSRKGRLQRRFSVREMPRGEIAGDDRHVPEETYFRKVLISAGGNILLLGGNQSPHPGRDIFVCAPDGSYIRTLVLPSRSRLIAAGKGNALYATDESGTQVTRFVVR
jgi:hypothetical protein